MDTTRFAPAGAEHKKRVNSFVISYVVLPLVLGIAVGFTNYGFRSNWTFDKLNQQDLVVSLLWTLIVTFIMMLLRILWTIKKEDSRALFSVRSEVVPELNQVIDDFQSLKVSICDELSRVQPFGILHKVHSSLNCKYTETLNEIISGSLEQGGGTIIQANPQKYVELLDKFLALRLDSYFATQRGGEIDPKYRLSWFFDDDDPEKVPDFPMTSPRKLQYLEDVDNNKNIVSKTRILLFSPTSSEFVEDFSSAKNRKEYFQRCKDVALYLADPKLVIKHLCSDGGGRITESQVNFVWDDFVMFDNEIVLKLNHSNSIYFGVKTQIEPYLLFARMFQEDVNSEQYRWFKPIDAEGIRQGKSELISWNEMYRSELDKGTED